MFLIIAAVLLQSPTLEDRVDAFLRGDAGAREALLKIGTPALRPLQKVLDKSPEKIGTLVFDIKKGAAYPKDSKVIERVESKVEVKVKNVAVADFLARIPEKCGASIIFETFEKGDLKTEKVTVEAEVMREGLDQFCRQAGLDYGVFHNVLVVGKPERLWPDGKSPRSFGPAAVLRQHITPDEEKMVKQLQAIQMNLDFQNCGVADIAGYIKELSGLPFQVPADVGPKGVTIRAADLKMLDALSVITQLRGMDFMIHEGRFVIDKREAIEKMLAGKK